jgi:DNA polymerase-3 subunit alpha
MEKQKEVFIGGAIANGIPEKKAARLFELMAFFAEYGFNKSHSAAYAYLAYQTAYLKAHYPVEFMTANLSADMGDTDKIVKLINECRNMSIDILPPDINESEREFKIVGSSVRFGLEAVKGVGSAAIEIILQERQNGSFKSFDEFLSRVDNKKVNKKVVEGLIKAGAFDSLYKNYNTLSVIASPNYARAKAIDVLTSSHRANNFGPGLFGDSDIAVNEVQPWDETTLLSYEKDALGFYISGHPLTRYRKTLSTMDVIQLSDVEDRDERADVTVAGIISEIKTRAKEKGVTAYLNLEDETGSCEMLVFPDLYKKSADLLKKGNLTLIRGQVFKSEKGAKVMAREIQNLSDMELCTKYEVAMKCDAIEDTVEKLRTIKRLMGDTPNGKDSVSFRFYLPDYCVIIASKLPPRNNFAVEAERIAGVSIKAL